MSFANVSAGQLRELPAHEITEEIEAVVEELFKDALLMEAEEELPLSVSYFDLGLTSLKLTRIKQQLEVLLDVSVDTTVLFNEPTVEHLVRYLSGLLASTPAADLPAAP
ncbi:acyl carrier protein [Streptomyces sp. S.PNR 29]|uniref:acyl carrier protein n=1 Tax=Streptomyces sp. S.PNR 29 TaxID=2973805 RepID=UPI0025B02E77|nr:acyl carrier protein [Streptomyces sp. S.PNR 29]MDN0197937.1 acyl carrier protein [Streptomyces sp. S.PNR 29]